MTTHSENFQQTHLTTTVIKPANGFLNSSLMEVWQYRELLYYFVWRDIMLRYKQTIMGAAWAILQPLMQMIVFSFIFGTLANLDSDGIPQPIFQYAALVPWTFFASGLGKATSSLVSNSGMLKKIYFPRLILPISSVASGIVDFLLAMSILVLMMLYFDVAFTWRILYLPLFLGLAFMTALGVSLWLAPLNVLFRDVRYATPFLIQMWFWITPAAYSSSNLSAPLDSIYALNPMAGVVEGFRWAMAGADTEPGAVVLASALISFVVMITGFAFYQRMESTFADVV